MIFQRQWGWFIRAAISLKADACSRVNSTVHTIIVVPGILYGLASTRWNDQYEPLTSVTTLQVLLLITVGYFIADLFIIVWYRVPKWEVFVAHHVAAVLPYLIYFFVPACPAGLFVLSCFLLVEFTNFFLNAQVFLEQCGRGSSKWYVAALYGGVIAWVFVRIINPLYLIYVLHAYILPTVSQKSCFVLGVVSAYFIAIFCIFVFFHVLLPEVHNRWKAYPKISQVAEEPSQSKALKVNPDMPLTPEELSLTANSPARIVLYEAREKAYEIEKFVVDHTVEMRLRRPYSSISGEDV